MSQSRVRDFFNTRLGRIIIGIIKLAIAPLIIALVNAINVSDFSVGGTTVPISMMFKILVGFVGVLVVVSALRDLEVL